MTKRLWRREAKNGNGRHIKYMAQMQEMMFKTQPRTYPLLDKLFEHAGMTYVLSNKQQQTLKGMIEKANEQTAEESTNEVK